MDRTPIERLLDAVLAHPEIGTQTEMARRMQVSRSAMVRWFGGGATRMRKRHRRTLDALARQLEITADQSVEEAIAASVGGWDGSITSASALPAAKVATLNWPHLSAPDREALWQYFCTLAGSGTDPAPWLPASDEAIAQLEERYPLQLAPLYGLGAAFSIMIDSPLALSPEGLLALRNDLIGSVTNAVAAGGLQDQQRQALNDVLTYLSVEGTPPDEMRRRQPDLILIPGTRAGHLRRAKRAAEIALTCRDRPLIVLSGSHPGRDGHRHWSQIAEAEALEYALRAEGLADYPDNLIVRQLEAASLRDTVHLLVPHLHRLAGEAGGSVVVAVVASPFVLRRIVMSLWSATWAHPGLIERIDPHSSLNIVDLAAYLTRLPPDRLRNEVAAYVGEYMKLIGGRLVGEF